MDPRFKECTTDALVKTESMLIGDEKKTYEEADLESGVTKKAAAPVVPTAQVKPKYGNPAVVGLAGFASTTLVLQLHNLELCGIAPVIALGMVYGGGAQLIAGFMEMALGNNFGFCAFAGYGCFWISLCSMLLFKAYHIYPVHDEEIGIFLITFTIFTAILFAGTFKRSKGEVFLFGTLLLGFILLDLEKFGHPECEKPAAYVLIITALTAFYAMAHAVLKDIFGYDVVPMGGPIFK